MSITRRGMTAVGTTLVGATLLIGKNYFRDLGLYSDEKVIDIMSYGFLLGGLISGIVLATGNRFFENSSTQNTPIRQTSSRTNIFSKQKINNIRRYDQGPISALEAEFELTGNINQKESDFHNGLQRTYNHGNPGTTIYQPQILFQKRRDKQHLQRINPELDVNGHYALLHNNEGLVEKK